MTFGSKKRCRATGKRTAEQCKNPAMKGSDFCFLHGGGTALKRGAPMGNKNNLRHGVNSKTIKEYKLRIVSGRKIEHGFLAFNLLDGEEERETFLDIVGSLYKDFDPEISSTFYEIELLAMTMILFRRAVKNGDFDTVESLDRIIRLRMRDLKRGKPEAKEVEDGKTSRIGTTPAEWAASLLKNISEEEEREQAGQPEHKREEDEERWD